MNMDADQIVHMERALRKVDMTTTSLGALAVDLLNALEDERQAVMDYGDIPDWLEYVPHSNNPMLFRWRSRR